MEPYLRAGTLLVNSERPDYRPARLESLFEEHVDCLAESQQKVNVVVLHYGQRAAERGLQRSYEVGLIIARAATPYPRSCIQHDRTKLSHATIHSSMRVRTIVEPGVWRMDPVVDGSGVCCDDIYRDAHIESHTETQAYDSYTLMCRHQYWQSVLV